MAIAALSRVQVLPLLLIGLKFEVISFTDANLLGLPSSYAIVVVIFFDIKIYCYFLALEATCLSYTYPLVTCRELCLLLVLDLCLNALGS